MKSFISNAIIGVIKPTITIKFLSFNKISNDYTVVALSLLLICDSSVQINVCLLTCV